MDTITTAETKKANLAKYGLIGATAATGFMTTQPANATTTTPIEQIVDMTTDINTIVIAIVGVALGALGFRVGVKMFNRMTAKG